jgi:hypothetical protein
VNRETARALKASKLLWALEAQGKRVGVDSSSVAGCNDLAEMLDRLDDAGWLMLASLARVKPPSEDTRILVLLMLKAKASFLFEQPAPKSLTASGRGESRWSMGESRQPEHPVICIGRDDGRFAVETLHEREDIVCAHSLSPQEAGRLRSAHDGATVAVTSYDGVTFTYRTGAK